MSDSVIEKGTFDLIKLFDLISAESVKERNAIPPINEMLYWWTRKPLIVSRSVILASTLGNIESIKYLLNLGREKRAYTYSPNRLFFQEKFGKDLTQFKVLDPFGGGGNLLFEAKRLGLDCHASDYNPVAYLLMKSILEYPGKYGNVLETDFNKYATILLEKTSDELGKFFRRSGKKALSYIWMWCIKCPFCKQRIPLTQHMWLAKLPKKKIGLKFEPTNDLNFETKIVHNISEKEGNLFTQKRGKALCIRCRNSIGSEYLTNNIAKHKDREVIAIVVQDHEGKGYELPTEEDRHQIKEASNYLQSHMDLYEQNEFIPSDQVRSSLTNSLTNYGVNTWSDFYSERQLLIMVTLLKYIAEISNGIKDREYAKVIATYLSFILCKHVNRNCVGTSWQQSGEKIGHALAFRRPTLAFNYTEVNPFEKTSGGLIGIVKDIATAIRFASSNAGPCTVSLNSVLDLSTKRQNEYDLIITDPPYADDVQFGELSDFFYVWLYKGLKNYYPELPTKVPIEEDISVSLFRFGNLKLANDFYEKAMGVAFQQIHSVLRDGGVMVLFFSHSSTEAWNLLLQSLRKSKFKVVSSYALHTESTTSTISRGRTSFMSSIVVVCKKILDNRVVYFEDLLPRIEDKIKRMMRELTTDRLVELPITDLLVMTYGKVLEETTQHTILKSYRTDFVPDFETLIKDAREVILKEIVTLLVGKSPNAVGADTSFYIVSKVFYRNWLSNSEALKVAWAYQLRLEDLEKKQITIRDQDGIRVLFYDEMDIQEKPEEIDRNDLHKQLLYLEWILDKEGIQKVKSICSQYNNFRINDIKQIVNLLLKSFRMRINKKETLLSKEQNELKNLETLADILNSSKTSKSNLENYMV